MASWARPAGVVLGAGVLVASFLGWFRVAAFGWFAYAPLNDPGPSALVGLRSGWESGPVAVAGIACCLAAAVLGVVGMVRRRQDRVLPAGVCLLASAGAVLIAGRAIAGPDGRDAGLYLAVACAGAQAVCAVVALVAPPGNGRDVRTPWPGSLPSTS